MTAKEWVIPDILCALDTESFGRISIEQFGQEIASLGTHIFWESQWVRQDLAVHFVCVLVVERREAGQL